MRLYSPQALAFLGDAVYELLVRERIVLKANRPVSELHLQAVEQVRASYQSQAYAVIEPLLTEEEAAALKRGRNLNSVKPPKNGNVRDYRRATGLESLFGYLYVQGRLERINELFLAIERLCLWEVYRLLVISDIRFSRVLGLAFLSFIFTISTGLDSGIRGSVFRHVFLVLFSHRSSILCFLKICGFFCSKPFRTHSMRNSGKDIHAGQGMKRVYTDCQFFSQIFHKTPLQEIYQCGIISIEGRSIGAPSGRTR